MLNPKQTKQIEACYEGSTVKGQKMCKNVMDSSCGCPWCPGHVMKIHTISRFESHVHALRRPQAFQASHLHLKTAVTFQ